MIVKNLTILQWNVRQYYGKEAFLSQLCCIYQPDVILLQEVWTHHTTNIIIPGYHVHLQPRCDNYGGIAICVHRSIDYDYLAEIEQFSLNNI